MIWKLFVKLFILHANIILDVTCQKLLLVMVIYPNVTLQVDQLPQLIFFYIKCCSSKCTIWYYIHNNIYNKYIKYYFINIELFKNLISSLSNCNIFCWILIRKLSKNLRTLLFRYLTIFYVSKNMSRLKKGL